MEWKNICESGNEPDENVAFWPPQVAARQCLMTYPASKFQNILREGLQNFWALGKIGNAASLFFYRNDRKDIIARTLKNNVILFSS